MCVILFIPNKRLNQIETGELEGHYLANRDGIGYAWTDGEMIHVYKTLDFHIFLKQFEADRKLAEEAGSGILLHFRQATHGEISKENAHPFWVNRSVVFAHNGVLRNFSPSRPGKSDTREFLHRVLRHLPEDFMFNIGIMRLIEEAIDPDRMGFFHVSGEFRHIGGSWVEGIWYSNLNSLARWDLNLTLERVGDQFYDIETGEEFKRIPADEVPLVIESENVQLPLCDFCGTVITNVGYYGLKTGWLVGPECVTIYHEKGGSSWTKLSDYYRKLNP